MAIGNRCRGDDGVAPVLIDRLSARQNEIAGVTLVIEEVYQLQPEHIYDLEQADALLVIDAAVHLDSNVSLCPIRINEAAEVGTHTLSPGNLLGLYLRLLEKQPPPGFLLTIKASEFGFTEQLSSSCQRALDEAESFLLRQLATPALLFKQQSASNAVHATKGEYVNA